MYRDSSPNAVSANAEFDLTRFWIPDRKIRVTRVLAVPCIKFLTTFGKKYFSRQQALELYEFLKLVTSKSF